MMTGDIKMKKIFLKALNNLMLTWSMSRRIYKSYLQDGYTDSSKDFIPASLFWNPDKNKLILDVIDKARSTHLVDGITNLCHRFKVAKEFIKRQKDDNAIINGNIYYNIGSIWESDDEEVYLEMNQFIDALSIEISGQPALFEGSNGKTFSS